MLVALRAAAVVSVLLVAGHAAAQTAQETAAPSASGSISTETSAEAGVELDSNVSRLDKASGPPVRAILARLGARLDAVSVAPSGGVAALTGVVQVRNALSSDVTSENLTVLSVDGQWIVPVRSGELRLGPRISYRDAIATFGDTSDRAFRAANADLMVVLPGPRAHVTVSIGPRGFSYKPNGDYSWLGGGAVVRLDWPLWSGAAEERSLDAALVAAVEQRAYRSSAFLNVCTPEERLSVDCFVATPRPRGDRVHRASVTLAYSGGVVATGEAQLTVVDSNSFGRSWIGGRVRGAITVGLGKLYATATVTAQLDRYTEGLLVLKDPEVGVFDSIVDDSRSSAELRLGLPLRGSWSLEARAVAWADLSRTLEYERQVGSLGVVWGR